MRPRSLVQIHYHCRPGGVTAVMAAYAQAFGAVVGRSAPCVLACSPKGAAAVPAGTVLAPVPGAEYHEFRSASSLRAASSRLQQRLRHLLLSGSLPAPVCVIAHNLNLARNVALADAFGVLSRQLGGERFRFFMVVHDRAEEGRERQLRHIHSLARMRVPVWRMLYPRVHYVSPSRPAYAALHRAGASAALLPNPVSGPAGPPPAAAARAAFRAACAVVARRRGVPFDSRRPLVFYPSRMLRRKNPVEACIVACLVMGGTLLTGRDGTSAEDRTLCRRLRRICVRLGIPALFDIEEVQSMVPALRGKPFMSVCGVVDVCLSTAVLEGFGYALYEPWLYGAAVVGRRPAGFGAFGGASVGHLYEMMRVPGEWVDGEPRPSVDFGTIPVSAQLGVLERLMRDPNERARLRFGTARSARRVPVTQVAARDVAANRRRISSALGPERFRAQFAAQFLRRAAAQVCPPVRVRPK